MGELISKIREDGSTKSRKEIETETKLLLNQYRRQNLYLHDRLFDIQMNVLTRKDELISQQKDQIKKLCEDIEKLKNNSKSWW